MGARTNRQILTRGDDIYARKKEKVKNRVAEVTFDPSARAEYLTGFHKRKVQRKENAQQRAQEVARKEKLEERKRVRQERKEAFETELQKFDAAMKEINRYDDSGDESEVDWTSTTAKSKSKANGNGKANDSDFSDWEGISESDTPKPILKRRQSFQEDDGESTTTVVIEEMDSSLSENFVDLTQSKKVLQESMDRAQRSAIVSGAVAKPKKKKFRYLTKQERGQNRSREKANHMRKREK